MAQGKAGHTSDIVIEDVIFVDGAVNDLFGVFVENQYFPLQFVRQRQWIWFSPVFWVVEVGGKG